MTTLPSHFLPRSCCSDDKNIVSIKGGSVYNAVPETAQAIVAGISEDDIEAAMVKADCDVLFTLEKIDGTDNIRINVEGKGVHASTPEEGRNANSPKTNSAIVVIRC